MYDQPSVNNAMPLFAFLPQTWKFGDGDIKKLMAWGLVRNILLNLSVFIHEEHNVSELLHVDHPSIHLASRGIVSGSEGIRSRHWLRSRLPLGIA